MAMLFSKGFAAAVVILVFLEQSQAEVILNRSMQAAARLPLFLALSRTQLGSSALQK